MKKVFALTILATVLTGCRSTHELAHVDSPDRQARAVITLKETHGVWVPGPEPPKTLGRWAKCVVMNQGKEVYDSGFESIGVYPFPFDFDVAWAPDSGHVAYRSIATLRVLDRQGSSRAVKIPCTNSLISSFKWISPTDLLLVVKEPIVLYAFKPTNVMILRLNLERGVSERYAQRLAGSTLISHAIGREIQEISPFSDRVAFSDGASVCVYDDAAGKVIARVPIHASLDGVWWETEDKLLLDLGASSGSEQFMRFNLKDGALEDCSTSLRLLEYRKYASATWFNPEDDFREHTEIPSTLLRLFNKNADQKDLRRWIDENLPEGTSLIYHGWSYPSLNAVSEVWLLNCPEGFALQKEKTPNRTVELVPATQAFNIVAELYGLGIKLGGKRPSEIWRVKWKTDDENTDVTGIVYPHADGEILRIERLTHK